MPRTIRYQNTRRKLPYQVPNQEENAQGTMVEVPGLRCPRLPGTKLPGGKCPGYQAKGARRKMSYQVPSYQEENAQGTKVQIPGGR